MRILYSHRIQSRDGQSVHLDEIVAALRQLGHDVVVVGPRLYESAGFGGESRLVAALRRRVPRALLELAELAYNIPAFLRLRRVAAKFQPDLIYERYNLYFLAGILLRRWRGVKLFLEVNAPVCEERARYGGLALPRLAGSLQRWVWRSADRTLVVTDALKRIVIAAGAAPETVSVVPNGIDPRMFPAEPYRARRGAPVTIGFIGFVRDWHGLNEVIDALAGERDGTPVELVIAGEGPARAGLQRRAAALGIGSRVRFIGLQPRSAIAALIGQFDIALQPRAVPYASPLKIFEYMACGRAIVAPDQPNIREILTDGETALLFDPDAPGALWQAIRRLVDDPALRERLGQAARRALEARDYTWRRNAQRIVAMAGELHDRDSAEIAPDRVGSL
ncbi:MAG TPA: glycosyltransferase family 4 protein [Stellaceae bacterium]|nr:glycosyltransferase family 4 protein [Stellaceae bacterium]